MKVVDTPTHLSGEAFARFFTVLKSRPPKITLRTIFHTVGSNVGLPPPPPVNLPSIPEWTRAFAHDTFLWTADMRHFFHEFGLHEQIRNYFFILCRKKWFRCACLPMGLTWAPFVAQAFAWWLAVGDIVFSWTELPRVFVHMGVHFVIWYDNLLLGGASADVLAAVEKFNSRRLQVHGVLKEESTSFDGSWISFVGLDLCAAHSGQTMAWKLATKTIEKIKRHTLALSGSTKYHGKRWESLRGLLVWCHWAQQLHFFRMVHYFKCSELPEADRTAIRDLLTKFETNPPQRHTLPSRTEMIFSDASTRRWAIVPLTGIAISNVFGRKFTCNDIFFLEAIAVKQTALHVSPRTDLVVPCDNMAIVHSVNRGITACPRTARILAEAADIIRGKDCTLRCIYICTEENPADEPSRNKPVILEKLFKAAIKIRTLLQQ